MKGFTSVLDLLTWFIYSGGALLVASWILEQIPSFAILSVQLKKTIVIAASAVLAIAAYALITYLPPAIFSALDPYLLIVSGIIVLYSGGQVVHSLTK